MKSLFTITLFILTSFQQISSQEKKALNKSQITTKNKIFTVITPIKNNLFQVNEYYANGKIKMEGFYTDIEKEIFQGKIIWFDKNGNKTVANYNKNGQLHGKIITYLTNGYILSKGKFKDGKPYCGIIKKDNTEVCVFENYKKWNKVSELKYYHNTKLVAAKKEFNPINKNIVKELYYDKKGKTIAELFFSTKKSNQPNNGTQILFYKNKAYPNNTKTTINWSNGKKSGEEITYNQNGEQWLKGINVFGNKQDGDFLTNYTKTSYREGIQIGEEITYDNDFKEITKYTFIEGKPYNGVRLDYKIFTTHKKGKKIKEIEYYDKNFKTILSEKIFIGKENYTIKWFNKKGNLIGQGKSVNNEPYSGLHIFDNNHYLYENGKRKEIVKILK